MNAKDNIREQLSAYLDGELSDAQAKVVEQTLAHDADLARELEALRATQDLLRSLPKAPAPKNFAANVLAEARSRGLAGQSPAKTSGRSRWIRMAGMAAMLVMAMGLGMLLSQKIFRQPTAGPHHEIAAAPPAEPTGQDVPGGTSRGWETDDGMAEERVEGAGEARTERAVPAPATPAPVIGKGGVTYDAYDGRVSRRGARSYDFASNAVDARNEAFAKLDEINGKTVEIYVDDLPSNQAAVEQVMFANGIALAPDEQAVIAPNQAVNLMTNRNFFEAQNTRPAPDVEEVQYLVYGKQEQLQQLAKALDENVVRRQTVSQLPEPVFRQAIELAETAGAKTGNMVEKKDTELSNMKATDEAVPAGPNPAMPAAKAAKPETAAAKTPPAPRDVQAETPTRVEAIMEGELATADEEGNRGLFSGSSAEHQPSVDSPTRAAPLAEPESEMVAGSGESARAADEDTDMRLKVTDPEEVARRAGATNWDMQKESQQPVAAEPAAVQPTPEAAAEPLVDGDSDDKIQQAGQAARMSQVLEQARTQPLLTGGERAPQSPSAVGVQQGYVLRGDVAGVPATDAMIITLRRRVSPSRLNYRQQQNLDVVERQYQYDQLRRTSEATTQPQAAPPNATPQSAGQ